MWVKERNDRENKEKCVNRAIVPDRRVGGQQLREKLRVSTEKMDWELCLHCG